MRISRHLFRAVRAVCAACDRQCQQSALCVRSLGDQGIAQPGIDYALWARQQQAWRCYAAPARAVQDSSMEDVAERKLSEAHSRYQELQILLEGTNPSSEAYQRLMKESAALTPLVEGYEKLQQLRKELSGVQEMLAAESDKELQAMAEDERSTLQQQMSELRQSLMLALLPPETCDGANVVLEVRSSVGGDWVGQFTSDLLDMYRRFAAEQGWRFEVLETRAGDIGGVKSATALVNGPGAFGQLRWESGVHRATMVPENEKHGKMQTGTAVVMALPEASEVELKIAETDLRIETCRASGKGGQHVNTTDSAVRIVHLPTGIAVSCQNERSQGQNRAQAMRVLRAKLFEMEVQKQAAAMSAQRKAVAGLANTNERIRSYNYQDGRVSDHRVGLTINIDVARFMADGDKLAQVIHAVRLQHQQELLQEMLSEG